ncbi:helix-turn-helix domain-containing protein [Ekhidna sp.]|uniref:helix-turn-helix domain-containing protein n=1 Tax=Ekhidna sp. TaxID=2608089 RepID=UPI003C7C1C84
MIDFYWLKSFTEILQLFIAALFLIYLKVKYNQPSPLLSWLSVFLVFKCLEDLYGVINYTEWIETLLTRELLDVYRLFMATVELGMLAAYALFLSHLNNPDKVRNGKELHYFLPAVLIAPLNLWLVFSFDSSLLSIFILVRLIFTGTLIYLIIRTQKISTARTLTTSMTLWNILWLAEVVLHEQFSIISEPASWTIFVLSEVAFTFGITYFLVQVIANPKLLRSNSLSYSLPDSLIQIIEKKLKKTMEEEKLYRNSDLTLPKLSETIDIQPSDLTQYMNRVLNKNFNQYLTSFRIEESIQLLENSKEQRNIEQIMHHAGFNSKSVFNTAFRKETGKTPSAFRKKHQ